MVLNYLTWYRVFTPFGVKYKDQVLILLLIDFRYDDIFSESMAKFYIAEMTQAIHALHCMGYVHR